MLLPCPALVLEVALTFIYSGGLAEMKRDLRLKDKYYHNRTIQSHKSHTIEVTHTPTLLARNLKRPLASISTGKKCMYTHPTDN